MAWDKEKWNPKNLRFNYWFWILIAAFIIFLVIVYVIKPGV